MPVPDALCIIFSGPVVTIILSVIILGDKITGVKCVSASLLLIGVIFVCQPPFLFPEPDSEENLHHTLRKFLLRQEPHHEGLYYVGVLMAVTGCITGGFMDVFISKCQVPSALILTFTHDSLGCFYIRSGQLVLYLRTFNYSPLFPSTF